MMINLIHAIKLVHFSKYNTWMLKTERLCKPSRFWSWVILLVPRNKLCKDDNVSRFSMTFGEKHRKTKSGKYNIFVLFSSSLWTHLLEQQNPVFHTLMRLEPSSSISRSVKCSRLAMLLILLWSRNSFFTRVSRSKPSTFLRRLKDTSSSL